MEGWNNGTEPKLTIITKHRYEYYGKRKEGAMQIIVHHPVTKQGAEELKKMVAQVHAQAVLSHLQKKDCPPEQKTQVIESLIQADTKIS